MFNTGDLKGTGRKRWVTAATDLDAGLLIRAQYVLVRPEWLALPGAGVQIEHRSSQFQKVRIARKDPALVSPGAEGIVFQQSPNAAARRARLAVTQGADLSGDLGQAIPTEWHVALGWPLTRQCHRQCARDGRMQVGRPRRGRSLSPAQRWTTKRAIQRRTVVRLIPACCARRRDPNPAALPRISRARRARRCAVVPARTQPCN